MLSSSPLKIHEPRVTGVSPRPTDRRQRQKTAKHELACGCRELSHVMRPARTRAEGLRVGLVEAACGVPKLG
jgi:hypothetical protein